MKDARFAALAGADAIGLNFYEKSPRCIDLATAEEVLPVVPKTVAKVGVFVNAPPDEIERIANLLDLDYLQLHGDEPPEFLGNFVERKLIRGFRCGEEGFAPIAAYLDSCKSLGRIPDAVLLDAHRPGEYGGTGRMRHPVCVSFQSETAPPTRRWRPMRRGRGYTFRKPPSATRSSRKRPK